jgi:hypothetical protein
MFAGGLRATAFASCLAVPMMIETGSGLIVNITWVLDRPHGHAFYEVVKNGTNKLTEQMADDLRPFGIACVAVSPGFMRLERMDLSPEVAAKAESAEFPGRAIAALASDPNVMAKSGGVFITPSLPASTTSPISTANSNPRSGPNTGPEPGSHPTKIDSPRSSYRSCSPGTFTNTGPGSRVRRTAGVRGHPGTLAQATTDRVPGA